MKINNDIFLSYQYCNYKAYLKLKGKNGEISDYSRLQTKLQQDYKSIATSSLIHRNKKSFVLQKSYLTKFDLIESVFLALDTTVEKDFISFHFDAIKQISGQSSLGSFYYIPILFNEKNTSNKQHKLLLSLGGLVLEHLQGFYPGTGIIVYGNDYKFSTVHLDKYRLNVQKIINELIDIINGSIVPKLILNKYCRMCQYEKLCFDYAKREDDLSLLSRIGEKDIKRFNQKGIFTVNQLSYTFRPRRRNKRAKTKKLPYYFSLNALAIREQKVYIFDKPNIPTAKTQIFIDMEGNANGSVIYLIGLLVVVNSKKIPYYFWANTPSLEKEMFEKFITFLSELNGAHIFYYGSYESRVFKRMLPIVTTDIVKALLLNSSTNILSKIYSRIYFPTYSNELKDIGRYLGCKWSNPNSSGLQSIVWRAQWENTNDNKIKNVLVQYNQEDCIALEKITMFIRKVVESDTPEASQLTSPESKFVDEIRQNDESKPKMLGKKESAFEGYNEIIECAYFDYQRTKVYIRTNDKLKRINTRKNKNKKRVSYRINKKIEYKSYKCPICKSKKIFRDQYNYHAKKSFDLYFSSGGIRRRIIKHLTAFHKCLNCEKFFVPPQYKKVEVYGHNLKVWSMHQHVVNRMTFENITKTVQDCFGLPIIFQRIYEFKSILAKYYKATYEKLFKKIVNGKILHADETPVKLLQDSGYVWAFTSMEEVVYLYRPNRNADFLHDLLKDFQGVLITDYYTGYDSVKCAQQKCLVHLIRDVNDNLLKFPFDEELQKIGQMFGSLLRSIVKTIDRFGLKRRYLGKHKKEVKRYFDELSNETYTSDVAENLRKRMLKYQLKLFLFLDYDGVPWNNNNGEHAIKPFAKYRRLVNGQISEKGLNDYLILLSIYQTCEYKGINFLAFLLSTERDVDNFSNKS